MRSPGSASFGCSNGDGEMTHFAVVSYLDSKGVKPSELVPKLRRMTWAKKSERYRVISLKNLIDITHVVPHFGFEKKEYFFVNKYCQV